MAVNVASEPPAIRRIAARREKSAEALIAGLPEAANEPVRRLMEVTRTGHRIKCGNLNGTKLPK